MTARTAVGPASPTPGDRRNHTDEEQGTASTTSMASEPAEGERILNLRKVIEPLRQPHSAGKCGRCLGRSFDTTDLDGKLVWYCGKCDVIYRAS